MNRNLVEGQKYREAIAAKARHSFLNVSCRRTNTNHKIKRQSLPCRMCLQQLRSPPQLRPPVPLCLTWRVCWACPPVCSRSPRTSFPAPPSPRTPTPPLSASPRLWTTTTTSGAWRTARECPISSTPMILEIY